MALHALWNLGVAVAGQIRQAILSFEREEIDELCAARRLARACELLAAGDRVECARFARVRASGKCHFRAPVGRELLWRPRDRKSTRLNSSHVKTTYAVFCLKKKLTMTILQPSVSRHS